MKRFFSGWIVPLFGLLWLSPALHAQSADPVRVSNPQLNMLLGKWEVTSYSEQGTQVFKKQAPVPQAIKVYTAIRGRRASMFYGYNPEEGDELSRRASRAFQKWAIEDSTREVSRVAKAIETPYFAVFFADSTVALYNKEDATEKILVPQVKKYVFSPQTMSIDMTPPPTEPYNPYSAPKNRWEIQVLLLTETRMTLFLPEQASIVELEKRPLKLP